MSAQPWSDGGGHETVEHGAGKITDSTIYKCRDCGKMATRESKLENTPCNDDEDREEYEL